jgi:hypothetical protein
LSLNPVGAGLDGPFPVKAGCQFAAGARFGAHDGARTVNMGAAKVQLAFQPLPKETPLGAVNVSVQLVNAVDPVFLTVTVALKPCDHEESTR